MATSDMTKPNYGRRFVWLGITVVLLFGGYSLGWFWLAGRLEAEARTAIAGISREGVEADCANPTARGYPFRIGIYCDSVRFSDAAQGVSVEAGSFRSAGQIYDPMRLVAELDGPARIDSEKAGAFALDWDNLRASARLSTPLPQRLSLEGARLRAEPAPALRCSRRKGSRRICGRTSRISTLPAVSADWRLMRACSRGARCRRFRASPTSPSTMACA
jgi:hypothetical protein